MDSLPVVIAKVWWFCMHVSRTGGRKYFGFINPRLICAIVIAIEIYGKEKHTISSVKHGRGTHTWSCLAASGSSIIDDVKTDRSSRINSVQMGHPGILQKQPKSFSRQRNGMLLNGQVVLPIPAKWSMTCSYWRQNWMQRPTEDGCSKDLAEHLKAMSVAKDFYSQY